MKRLIILLLALVLSEHAWTKNLTLDQLLLDVKKSQTVEGKIDNAREAKFLTEKLKQQQLLQEIKSELVKQERLSKQLKNQLDINEQELAQLETELTNRSGILGELFGVARQAAGDLKADLNNSLVSAQFDDRTAQLTKIIDSNALPNIKQLEALWFTLQQEMTESGKVVYFNKEILSASGEPRQATVTRIGSFNALADGHYLRYLADTGKLVELARQPDSNYLNMAENFSASRKGIADIGIDPTRGVILSLLVQTPDSLERIDQGGLIGYIILSLGSFGFVYAIYRLTMLVNTGRKMQQQLSSNIATDDNPLGRILAEVERHDNPGPETVELILDEAITREVPRLEKGLSLIKLLAAVAPLLGLLGTVTGMIDTFQSISLFGTGDPKLMAGGISQALVTTMLGLCVAIPLLFLHSLMATQSKKLVQILDEQTAGLISRRAGL